MSNVLTKEEREFVEACRSYGCEDSYEEDRLLDIIDRLCGELEKAQRKATKHTAVSEAIRAATVYGKYRPGSSVADHVTLPRKDWVRINNESEGTR